MCIKTKTGVSVFHALIAFFCAYWFAVYSQFEPVALVGLVAFGLIFWLLERGSLALSGGGLVFSALFAAAFVAGAHIRLEGNTYSGSVRENLVTSYGPIDLVAFAFIGLGAYIAVAAVLSRLVAGPKPKGQPPISMERISRQRLIVCACVLVILWAPYLLAYWPGVIMGDSLNSLQQVLGTRPWGNHHPAAYTGLIALCIRVGEIMGLGVTGGCALYTVVQMTLLSLSLSYLSNWIVVRAQWPSAVLVALIAVFGVSSYVGSFSVAMWKDPLFTAAALTLSLLLFDCAWQPDGLNLKKGTQLLFLLCVVGLLRSNGLLVLFLVFGGFCLLLLRERKRWRLHLSPVVLSALALVLVVGATGPLYQSLRIAPAPKVESVGVLVNQMARVVAVGGNMSEEDRAYMEGLLPLEKYEDVYSPTCVDPLKWNEEFNGEGLERGLVGHWLSMAVKNPTTVLEAWELQTLGYWALNCPQVNLYETSIVGGVVKNESAEGLAQLQGLGINASNLLESSSMKVLFPLNGWWVPVSWANWLILFLCLCLWVGGWRRTLLGLLPALGVAASLVIASPMWYWPRYGAVEQLILPVVAMLFIILLRGRALANG